MSTQYIKKMLNSKNIQLWEYSLKDKNIKIDNTIFEQDVIFKKLDEKIINNILKVANRRDNDIECQFYFDGQLFSSFITFDNDFVLLFNTDISKEFSSRLKLESFFENSSFGYSLCDMNGYFLEINKKHAEMLGYTVDEVIGKHFSKFSEDSFSEEDKKQFQKLMKNGKYGPYNKKYLHKDGTIIEIEASGFVFKDVNGENYIWSIIENISEKRKKEKEVSNFFNISLDMLCIASLDGYFKKINPAFSRILGYSNEELLKKPFTDFIHPDDLEKTLNEVSNLSQGLTTTRFINRYRCKDGSYKSIMWNTTPDVESQLLYASAHDISEISEVKERLNLALNEEKVRNLILKISNEKITIEEKLLKSLNSILDLPFLSVNNKAGVFLLDQDTKELNLVVQNNSASDLLYNCNKVKLSECCCGKAAELKKIVSNYSIKDSKFTKIENKDHYSVPILDKDNNTLGVIFFYLDTNHKYQTDERRILNNLSSQLSELIQNHQQNKKLEEQKIISAHQSKLASIGELAAGVAHEINNPLMILSGLLFKTKNLNSHNIQLLEFCNKMDDNINKISKIINGLKTFSRVDKSEVRAFNPNDIITDYIDVINEIYSKSYGINLSLNLTAEKYQIKGCPDKFNQVFMNLLSNAKDAVKNEINRDIVIHTILKDNFVELKVKDSGYGIKQDDLDKIYDPFFTTKKIGEGTGIGMSIIHSIIKDMHGTIKIKSKENIGTEIIIKIPVLSEIVSLKKESTNVIIDDQYDLNILLIDDDKDVGEVTTFMFEQFGVNINFINDGNEILNFLNNHKSIDAIFCDYNMPNINGFGVKKKLKNTQFNQIPFYLLTGQIDLENKITDYNISGIVEKPFAEKDIKKVLETIEKLDTIRKVN